LVILSPIIGIAWYNWTVVQNQIYIRENNMSASHDHQVQSYNKAFAIGISLNMAFVVIEAVYGFAHQDKFSSMDDYLKIIGAYRYNTYIHALSFRTDDYDRPLSLENKSRELELPLCVSKCGYLRPNLWLCAFFSRKLREDTTSHDEHYCALFANTELMLRPS